MSKKTVSGIILTLLFIGMLTLASNTQQVEAPSDSSSTVGGYISQDTTWTLDGSPYIVVEDVVVESGVTLTIEAGVVVKFTSGTNLVIDGALVAKGNTTHPITFTSNSTDPAPGDWGSIRFRDSSNDALCKIAYGNIQYGTTGIIIGTASPYLSYLNISCNSGNGIYIDGGGGYGDPCITPTITRCNISHNGQNGIEVHGHHASPIITNNTIKHNIGNGIYCDVWAFSRPEILCNTISNNGQDAIFTFTDCHLIPVLISHNELFENEGCGIHSKYGSPQVIRNIIRKNKIGILVESLGPAEVPTVMYNHLYDNDNYDFYASHFDVDATYNWWGTTNETAIKKHIYDYYDDYNLGKVLYKPYLVPPIANFTFSPEMPYACGTVTFDASASFNPYGSIINYTWDFGDGNITTVTSPIITHTYTKSGNFNVTLTVTDDSD